MHPNTSRKGFYEQMKKFRTITLAVALTTALSFGAVGAHATHMDTGTTPGTPGTTGTTTTSGYTGSNYDATTGISPGTAATPTPYTGNGTDTGVLGQINGYGNNMMDRMSTTGTNTGNYDTSAYRTYATTAADDDGMDWGWLGLVGLIGLAGLRGNNKGRDESYK